MISVSFANALFVYTRTRKYSLAGRPIDKMPDTPSCRKIEYDDSYEATISESASPIKKVIDTVLSKASTKQDTPVSFPSSSSSNEIWVLDVWDPPLFNLYLMAVYSPLVVLLLWYGPLTFFVIAVFLPALSFYLYTMTKLFQVQQKDRTILHSEVLSEYEKTVVRPIVSAARRDASIGVDGEVAFYAPSLNHQFKVQPLRRPTSTTTSTASTFVGSGSPSKTEQQQPLLGSPVFPQSLGAANSIRERQSLPPFKLQYNPAGYYTGTPIDSSLNTSSSGRYNSEYHNSPLSRKSESSLFRRLHK